MKVNEIFYSLQGEGAFIGTPSIFVRVAGCNFKCKWCDTKDSWDKHGGENFSSFDLLQKIEKIPCKHIIITGGEPTMQGDLISIVQLFNKLKYKVHIETNGSFYEKKLIGISHITVSPKLDELTPEYIKNIVKYNHQVDYKFVVDVNPKRYENFSRVIEFITNNQLTNIYLQPMNHDFEVQTLLNKHRILTEWVMKVNQVVPDVRVLPQLHRLVGIK